MDKKPIFINNCWFLKYYAIDEFWLNSSNKNLVIIIKW
jgi:hypothetical protein